MISGLSSMKYDSLLLVCALLCGAAWREIYRIGWHSYKSFTHPDCASIYNGYCFSTVTPNDSSAVQRSAQGLGSTPFGAAAQQLQIALLCTGRFPEATIFSISDLQKHGPLPGLAHLSIATSKHHGMRNTEVTSG